MEAADPCKQSGHLQTQPRLGWKEHRDQLQTEAGGGRVNEMGDGASEAQVRTGWGRHSHDTQKVSQD